MNYFPSTRTETLPGPMPSPAERKATYEPVSCDFTDELEYAAIKKIPVRVSHWNEQDQLITSSGIIENILTEQKEEFLVLAGGQRVRLDHVSQIRML